MRDFLRERKFPDCATFMSPALLTDLFMQRTMAEHFNEMSNSMSFRSVIDSKPSIAFNSRARHIALFFIPYFRRLESGQRCAESSVQGVFPGHWISSFTANVVCVRSLGKTWLNPL